jgi:hypothetical protein
LFAAFTRSQKGQILTVLGREPLQLVIVRIPKRIAAAIQIATPPERREDTPIKLVFAVEDIAGARSRAVELGGTMNAVEREREYDMRPMSKQVLFVQGGG